jgi:hypothetical protein
MEGLPHSWYGGSAPLLIWRACPILDMEGLPHSWYGGSAPFLIWRVCPILDMEGLPHSWYGGCAPFLIWRPCPILDMSLQAALAMVNFVMSLFGTLANGLVILAYYRNIVYEQCRTRFSCYFPSQKCCNCFCTTDICGLSSNTAHPTVWGLLAGVSRIYMLLTQRKS